MYPPLSEREPMYVKLMNPEIRTNNVLIDGMNMLMYDMNHPSAAVFYTLKIR